MSYLIHFNKNHSKANGQFISGDGDSDGIVNDHAHRSKIDYKKENIKLYKQLRKDKQINTEQKLTSKYGNNEAIKTIAKDKKMQKVYKEYKDKLSEYEQTGKMPKGYLSAYNKYNGIIYVAARKFSDKYSFQPVTKFDDIYSDTYVNRISTLIEYNLDKEIDKIT